MTVSFLLRDLVAIIAVLEFNQWFTKLSTKDYKLVSDFFLLLHFVLLMIGPGTVELRICLLCDTTVICLVGQ